MHLVISPITFILFSIGPDHFTFSLNFILIEFAFILRKIRPYEFTIAMFESIMMLTELIDKITLHMMIHQAIFIYRNLLEYPHTIIHCNLNHRSYSKYLYHGPYHLSILLNKHHHWDG